jgi:hypothetical protein
VIGRCLALIAALVLACPAWADGLVRIDVEKKGGTYFVEVEATAAVPLAVAWDVMTDYDHMSRYVPDLKESRVASRNGLNWTVEQKGVTRIGPFTSEWESVREVDLTPMERTVSRQIEGRMTRSRSTLAFSQEGAVSRVVYRSETEPGYWIPAFISRAVIAGRIREHFDVMLAEMRSRAAVAATRQTESVSLSK